MTRAYFVSDLHLKLPQDERTLVFVAWLNRLAEQARGAAANRPTHLFLVGDIFDLWIGGHAYFVERFAELIAAIRALRAAGVELHYFEGNHDLHLRTYWQDQLGVTVHPDVSLFSLEGLRVRVEHGDLINPNDRGYRFLRVLLRTRVVTALALALPARLVNAIGSWASRTSRAHRSNEAEAIRARQERIRVMIRRHAELAFRERPFDLIVSGHVHVVDDHSFETAGSTVRSVNLGSWLEKPFRALELDRNGARFVELS